MKDWDEAARHCQQLEAARRVLTAAHETYCAVAWQAPGGLTADEAIQMVLAAVEELEMLFKED